MIDSRGFRANVGIIIANAQGRLFWGRRVGKDAWQFPQGGIQQGESPQEAMYRELNEEVGLSASDVSVLGQTPNWHYYHLPKQYIRYQVSPVCVGQKQIWFFLRLNSPDSAICLEGSDEPEFDQWHWVDYTYPEKSVIFFKQDVYKRVLNEFVTLR